LDNQKLPLSAALFRGPVNEVLGKPRSLFSNVLVVPDSNFDEEASATKTRRRFSLRGRDLRGAFLARSDFRQVDFTGANLSNARLDGAKLSGAVFGCADPGLIKIDAEGRPVLTNPRSLASWPRDGCTWLVGTSLNNASLLGARFDRAKMQGASLHSAQLAGASLSNANLSAANLDFANLQGATLQGTIFVGASLRYAQLQGADMGSGSISIWFGPNFNLWPDFRGALLTNAHVWRTRGGRRITGPPSLYAHPEQPIGRPRPVFVFSELTSVGSLDFSPEAHFQPFLSRPFAPNKVVPADILEMQTFFNEWMESVLKPISDPDTRLRVKDKLAILAPELRTIRNLIEERDWKDVQGKAVVQSRYEAELAALFAEMACKLENSPYVLRGLIRSGRVAGAGKQLAEFAQQVRTAGKCAGVGGLEARDLGRLDELARALR
jgi:uncharacterized protein YjbI with pentapeptide repeats